MTVKECYEKMGESYEDILGYMRSPERVEKFLRKMCEDRSLEDLEKAILAEDYAQAFRLIHTFKGIAANLGMRKMVQESSVLSEEFRHLESPVDKVIQQGFLMKQKELIKQFRTLQEMVEQG